MSGLIYRDRSAYDLRLNVVEGPLDLKQFSILKSGKIDVSPGVSVNAAIIGASHFFRFRLHDLVFYEVVACTDVLGEGKKIYCGPLRDVRKELEPTFTGKGRYRFISRMLSSKDGAGELRRMEELALEKQWPRNLGLVFRFPIGKSSMAPRTVINLGTGEGGEVIFAKTAHLYPNESTIVFTETSLISIGKIRELSMKKEKALCEA